MRGAITVRFYSPAILVFYHAAIKPEPAGIFLQSTGDLIRAGITIWHEFCDQSQRWTMS